MPLMDHLGELRRRLMICVVSLVVAACVLYMVSPQIIDFLMEPIKEFMTDSSGLVLFAPLSGFTIQFKVAFFASFVVCAPILIWQLLAFFLPALNDNERKWFIPTFVVGCFLFLLGEVFCYGVILKPAFGWMLGQSSAVGTVLPDAEEYIKLVMLFEIGFGIAFELPLVVFCLIVFNIVPYKKFRSAWRTVYIVLMVISAMVTPDASPVTMLLMYAAMVALYEISLLVARVVLSKRIAKQKAEGEDTSESEEALAVEPSKGGKQKAKK